MIGDQAGDRREHDEQRNAPVRLAALPEPQGGGRCEYAASGAGLRRAVAGVVLADQRLGVRTRGTGDGADVPACIEVCAAGGEVVAIAITPNGKTAYVVDNRPNHRQGGITPIDTAANTVGKPIRVGRFPTAIAITPNGETAYVISIGPHTVTPIDTATSTALKRMKVGGIPQALAITPDGETAYVVSLAPGLVTPINTATNTALAAIDVKGLPAYLAITP